MAIVKQLGQFAAVPLAMAAGVALSLWVLVGLLQVGQPTFPGPSPELVKSLHDELERERAALAQAEREKAELGKAQLEAERAAEREKAQLQQIVREMATVGDDSKILVARLQQALIRNGYAVGPAGADGNFNNDTRAALQAFQDNNALPVQPMCDDPCWAALDLPGPEPLATK